jgi:carboxyl-terminal processing protease
MKLSLLTKAFTIAFLFLTENNIFAQTKYQKDFTSFGLTSTNNYAYLESQNIDWNKVKEFIQHKQKKLQMTTNLFSCLKIR